MMKCEFDKLVGLKTEPTCYERVEYVYMNCDAIEDKYQIVKIYEDHDMNGIECIYHTIKGIATVKEMELAVRFLKEVGCK